MAEQRGKTGCNFLAFEPVQHLDKHPHHLLQVDLLCRDAVGFDSHRPQLQGRLHTCRNA